LLKNEYAAWNQRSFEGKRLQTAAKVKPHDIWQAEPPEHASQAFDLFLPTYQAKYPKAAECLAKDREA
jgi:hypothetical protein